jgi:hypothetical protein
MYLRLELGLKETWNKTFLNDGTARYARTAG